MKALTMLGLVIGLLTWAAQPATAELKVGDPAPDFQLQGSDGQTYKLSDYKGKQAVVLAWFPKAFTKGCTQECKSIKDGGAAIRKYDAKYFAASVDPQEGEHGNTAFAKSLEADYPILSDPGGAAAQAYGVYNPDRKIAVRQTFYIDKDGKIAAIDKTISTKNAGEDIAERLKELGVPEKK